MSALTINGSLIHYEVLGRGKPIILIHSWIGSWRYWIPLMQRLSAEYRVYSLDLMGFGDSSKDNQNYDFDSQVDILYKFLDALGWSKMAFIAHGLGALITLEFAQQYPDKVARMMLISLPIFQPNKATEKLYKPLFDTNPLQAHIGNPSLYDLFERSIGSNTLEYDKFKPDVERTDPQMVSASIKNYNVDAVNTTLQKTSIPTVILNTLDDAIIPAPPNNIITELNNDNIVSIVAKDGLHYPMVTNDFFPRFTLDFLSLPAEELSSIEYKSNISTTEKRIYKIFISYSRQDTDKMQDIKTTFVDYDFDVWVDTEGIEPGTRSWKRTIQDAIDESDCLVVLLSPDAKASQWVEAELDYAEGQEKPIFSVLVRGNKKTSAPFGYTFAQWVDIQSGYDEAIESLITTIYRRFDDSTN